jgi:hypothetical protein
VDYTGRPVLMRKLALLLISGMFAMFMFSSVVTAEVLEGDSAKTPPTTSSSKKCNTKNSSFFGLPTWYKYIVDTEATTKDDCVLKFDVTKDVPKVLLAVFEIILRVGGLVSVGFVIWGGIQYIISQGEPEKTKSARTTIINALVGLVITVSAVVIVNLIGNIVT